MRNETNFLSDFHEIMRNKTDIMIKAQNVRDNIDLFYWHMNVPFDVHMVVS